MKKYEWCRAKSLPELSHYLITKAGEIFSLKSGRFLKATSHRQGYRLVALIKDDGTEFQTTVHQLVARCVAL